MELISAWALIFVITVCRPTCTTHKTMNETEVKPAMYIFIFNCGFVILVFLHYSI